MIKSLSFPIPSIAWCRQVAEICVLNRYLVETFQLQQSEPVVRQQPDASALIGKILGRLREQGAELAGLLQGVPEGQRDLRPASAALAEVFIHFLNKSRSRVLSVMLRNDHVLLTLATTNYTLLHAASLSLGEQQAAQRTLAHLREIAGFAQEIARLMPALAVADFRVPSAPPLPEAVRDARANVASALGLAPADRLLSA